MDPVTYETVTEHLALDIEEILIRSAAESLFESHVLDSHHKKPPDPDTATNQNTKEAEPAETSEPETLSGYVGAFVAVDFGGVILPMSHTLNLDEAHTVGDAEKVLRQARRIPDLPVTVTWVVPCENGARIIGDPCVSSIDDIREDLANTTGPHALEIREMLTDPISTTEEVARAAVDGCLLSLEEGAKHHSIPEIDGAPERPEAAEIVDLGGYRSRRGALNHRAR